MALRHVEAGTPEDEEEEEEEDEVEDMADALLGVGFFELVTLVLAPGTLFCAGLSLGRILLSVWEDLCRTRLSWLCCKTVSGGCRTSDGHQSLAVCVCVGLRRSGLRER